MAKKPEKKVKRSGGGVTSKEMLKVGRNLARAQNQERATGKGGKTRGTGAAEKGIYHSSKMG